MNKFIETVEKAMKLVPAASFLLIAFGFIDLLFYYWLFGVHIIKYIDVSEVILSAIDNIISSLFFCLTIVFVFGLLTVHVVKSTFAIPFNLLCVAAILIYVIVYVGKKSSYHPILAFDISRFALYFLIVMLTIHLIYEAERGKTYDQKYVLVPVYGLLALIPLVLAFILTSDYKAKLERLNNAHNSQHIVFFLSETSNIATNDSFYFIGKTNGYFFFWQKDRDDVVVYPSGEIKKVVEIAQ